MTKALQLFMFYWQPTKSKRAVYPGKLSTVKQTVFKCNLWTHDSIFMGCMWEAENVSSSIPLICVMKGARKKHS